MKVRRLDLGADVVLLPARQTIFLHPQLNYGESLAAVSSVLPDLPVESVDNLVAQVTTKPVPEPKRHRRIRLALSTIAAVLLTTLLVGQPPATASHHGETFGQRWVKIARHMGFKCHRERKVRVCVGEHAVYRVVPYGNDRSILYVLTPRDSALKPMYVATFNTEDQMHHFIGTGRKASVIGPRSVSWG